MRSRPPVPCPRRPGGSAIKRSSHGVSRCHAPTKNWRSSQRTIPAFHSHSRRCEFRRCRCSFTARRTESAGKSPGTVSATVIRRFSLSPLRHTRRLPKAGPGSCSGACASHHGRTYCFPSPFVRQLTAWMRLTRSCSSSPNARAIASSRSGSDDATDARAASKMSDKSAGFPTRCATRATTLLEKRLCSVTSFRGLWSLSVCTGSTS